jgi:integrase
VRALFTSIVCAGALRSNSYRRSPGRKIQNIVAFAPLKRRLEDAGLPDLFSPHSFRVTVVTDLLNQNVPLEDVQYLAGRSSPTTTRVYDRRRRKVTRNIVERISI